MKSCFVRSLWGESDLPIRDLIVGETRIAAKSDLKDVRWYCFGQENADVLNGLGVESTMLDREPLCRFGSTEEKNPRDLRTINFGRSLWMHKYASIQAGLKDQDAVIWLDMDTLPVAELPDDFWEKLAKGPAFQCSLIRLRRPRAYWRSKECGFVPCGSLIYVRKEVIGKIQETYATMPEAFDLTMLAKFFDDTYGWNGAESYRDGGYNPGFHQVKHQVFVPEKVLFRSGSRGGLRMMARMKMKEK